MGNAGPLYQLTIIAAFVGAVAGAVATFKRAPPGKRWLGVVLVLSWCAVEVVVPFLIGVATGAGVAPDPATTRGVVAVLSLGVGAFGLALYKRF